MNVVRIAHVLNYVILFTNNGQDEIKQLTFNQQFTYISSSRSVDLTFPLVVRRFLRLCNAHTLLAPSMDRMNVFSQLPDLLPFVHSNLRKIRMKGKEILQVLQYQLICWKQSLVACFRNPAFLAYDNSCVAFCLIQISILPKRAKEYYHLQII